MHGSARSSQLQTQQRGDKMRHIMTDRHQGHSVLPYRPAPSYFIHKNRAILDSCFFFVFPSFRGSRRRLDAGATTPVAPPILTPLVTGISELMSIKSDAELKYHLEECIMVSLAWKHMNNNSGCGERKGGRKKERTVSTWQQLLAGLLSDWWQVPVNK